MSFYHSILDELSHHILLWASSMCQITHQPLN